MSLKAFHLFFIAASVRVCFGFGAWGIYDHATRAHADSLALGLLSLGIGVVLIFYGRKFRQKFSHLASP